MEKGAQFADFDDKDVYTGSWQQAQLLFEQTRNFVVEFGKDDAHIAFNLEGDDVRKLLDSPTSTERPVRWINLWAPHQQVPIINLLNDKYKWSPRLHAIICSTPPEAKAGPLSPTKHSRFWPKHPKDDIEIATTGVHHDSQTRHASKEISHYTLAEQMVNYQSIDFGPRFLCIGANWMHELPKTQAEEEEANKDAAAEDPQKPLRLWSWLFLCDDYTVISVHQYPEQVRTLEELKATRTNTLSVLNQLSNCGHGNTDPLSMQTVRQALTLDVAQAHEGPEGASLLFYYLFDDWRAVYLTVAKYHAELDGLRKKILGDVNRKAYQLPNIEIITKLHRLGIDIRQYQNLYKGYQKLIHRILEPQDTLQRGSASTLDGFTTDNRGVQIRQSAKQRFERLSDRIQLLILSETQEFLAEKDALINTYFNINAQKDSESAARLTRSATLLAKLSVLFLPVSLMTSYFSVQIADLQGIYTAKDYWYSFAGIMSVSFLALFFFSRLLMLVTETLDGWTKYVSKTVTGFFRKRHRRELDEGQG